MSELILSERMPVLALRGLTVFPQTTMHFDVGREKSARWTRRCPPISASFW